MKTNTATAMRLVPKEQPKKRKPSPLVRIRREICTECRFIRFIAGLNLLVCFCEMVIMSILDSYIKDFITAMEEAGSISIGVSPTVAAFLVFVLSCIMTIFSFVMFLFLNSSADTLRNISSDLKEE